MHFLIFSTVYAQLVHPGMLSSIDQLKGIKGKLENSPWSEQLQNLQSVVSKAVLKVPDKTKMIFCGYYNLDENGIVIPECTTAVENGMDAYSMALLGYFTDNSTCSEMAIKYITTWADNFIGFDPTPREGAKGNNALLQAGWTAPWFANAAEILRYTYNGWTNEHTSKTTKLLNILLPQVSDQTKGFPNNWLHSRIEAYISIAVFLNDKKMLADAVQQFRGNTPSYFYIDSDGKLPPNPNRKFPLSTLKNTWNTPQYVAGMTMETCRDIGHQGLGVRSIFNSLAMIKTQGIDVFSGTDLQLRFTTFLEVQAQWMAAKAAPSGVCNDPILLSPSTGKTIDSATPIPFEIGYALLRNDTNLLPNAKAAIIAHPSTPAAKWVQKWETLLYHVE